MFSPFFSIFFEKILIFDHRTVSYVLIRDRYVLLELSAARPPKMTTLPAAPVVSGDEHRGKS